MKINRLIKTCNSYPAQWEGQTDCNKEIYIRYRHYILTIDVGGIIGEQPLDILTGKNTVLREDLIQIKGVESGELTDEELEPYLRKAGLYGTY